MGNLSGNSSEEVVKLSPPSRKACLEKLKI